MKKTTVKIDGMMCGMCEAHIADAIRRNFNAKKITASHIKGTAVILSENPIDREKLKNTISDTGYRVIGIAQEDYQKKGLFSVFSRKNS